MKSHVKNGIATALVITACAGLSFGFWKITYPFGRRGGGIGFPGIYTSLLMYAADHDGWFPANPTNALQALQLLYPYCPSGRELAGISGDPEKVAQALKSGQILSSNLSSWVYIPGLRQDDPKELALLWESRSGLYCNGRRNWFGGRAVLLVGGTITNVSATEWSAFEARQRELRALALQMRRTVNDISRPGTKPTPTSPSSASPATKSTN